ncbi:molybdate transport system ATP-binding protein [Microbacterium resistens]|uniref:Molybdate transport system ATP-binding protein n=1 Tax=Microbacterium resistens TaxID=156977 RepID=A0ABU1SEP9_9MICO|nr:ABC transporter ATP-binding protein [Microbacterium resistens]MDR6867738.1 molybdate transport system ATP-binding protein [Microbacterium resistens]
MSLDVDVRVRVGSFQLEAALTARPGEILAVLGPNGSGKSTLLGAIAGHAHEVSGQIVLDGRMLDGPTPDRAAGRRVRLPAEDRRVGLLGQRALLFPHLSALENVAFGSRAQGVRRGEARERARDWLAEVGLGDLEDRRPSALSGGQQQRVAIARALAARPDALLLDEPFAALDAQTATRARRLIAEQRDRAGVPMVLVTHDPMDAVVLAARTVILHGGRVIQDGPTAEVLGHPRSEFVAAVAGVNLLIGTAGPDGLLRTSDAHGASLAWAGSGEGLQQGEAGSAAFAPSAVRIRDAEGTSGGGSEPGRVNAWTGTVALMEPVPGGVRLLTEEHPDVAVICPSTVAATIGIRPGRQLAFSIAEDDVSVRRTG